MVESTATSNTRPRLSFSLLNLLLGSALPVAVISHVVASRELNLLKSEVRRLRTELGYLDIKDPKKCYVTSVPQLEQGLYLFRVYLPPGHGYSRRYSVKSKTQFGESIMGGSSSISESGELTFRAKIYRDESGEMQFAVSGSGSQSRSRFGPETAIGSASTSSTAATPPSNETREIAPGLPIELLTLEVEKSEDNKIRDSIKIWLEDASHPLANPHAATGGPSGDKK